MLLYELFQKVSDLNNNNNLRNAYIIAAFGGILWFMGQIGRNNGFYLVQIFVNKIRS
jgi:hypothetical protein